MTSASWPLIEIAVEPKSQADQEKLGLALSRLAADDTSFRFSVDRRSGQTILKGMDEAQLDKIVDTLRRTETVDATIGRPQVSYRETLTERAEVDYTHTKQTGGIGQFARVRFVVEPSQPGAGHAPASKIIGDVVPPAYLPGVEKGLDAALGAGILAGFPVVNIRIELVDVAYHDIDSSALVFEVASRAALREALRLGISQLLEPVMSVEVVAPEKDALLITRDLEGRRGRIQDRVAPDWPSAVRAMVPLAEMLGYTKRLSSLASGRATLTMAFSHYAPVPPNDGLPPPAAALALRA